MGGKASFVMNYFVLQSYHTRRCSSWLVCSPLCTCRSWKRAKDTDWFSIASLKSGICWAFWTVGKQFPFHARPQSRSSGFFGVENHLCGFVDTEGGIVACAPWCKVFHSRVEASSSTLVTSPMTAVVACELDGVWVMLMSAVVGVLRVKQWRKDESLWSMFSVCGWCVFS